MQNKQFHLFFKKNHNTSNLFEAIQHQKKQKSKEALVNTENKKKQN